MAANLLANGYVVLPAGNGGWMVMPINGTGTLGAFTTYRDLVDWIEAKHIDLARDGEGDRLVPREVPVTRHTNINAGNGGSA